MSVSPDACPHLVKGASSAVHAATAAAPNAAGGLDRRRAAGGCPASTHAPENSYSGSPASSLSSASNASPQPQAPSEINPRNMMPTDLGRDPAGTLLPRRRRVSSIPSAKDGEAWIYPSAAQFHSALARKGMPADPEDAEVMVDIHDELNERAWAEVLRWERLHCDPEARVASLNDRDADPCPPLFLHSLRGRSDCLSPRARFAMWAYGAPRPFDRHDWLVDRGGKRVRYVIDYYYAPPEPTWSEDQIKKHTRSAENDMSSSAGGQMSAPTAPAAFYLDVRPALDSPSALIARMRMWWNELKST